jgi:hypothetical protein
MYPHRRSAAALGEGLLGLTTRANWRYATDRTPSELPGAFFL